MVLVPATHSLSPSAAVSDLIRTSLGPRGMDKMIQAGNGETEITNDGATIMSKLEVTHPAARMMVELSKSQDVEAGDGTTTVVVLAGSLLHGEHSAGGTNPSLTHLAPASEVLLDKGIHPTIIAESFLKAASKAEEVLASMAIPVDLSNREELVRIATTSLSSKVVSAFSDRLASLAVDAVLAVLDDPKVKGLNDSEFFLPPFFF